nr:MAG TPA: hypothetical protein [Caudoviricetes sp.]
MNRLIYIRTGSYLKWGTSLSTFFEMVCLRHIIPNYTNNYLN